MTWVGEGLIARVDQEVERVLALCEELLAAYVEWGDAWRIGSTYQVVYGDVIDYVNFRVETAMSCIDLLKAGRVADGLGLCRSLLENYMTLMLMSRGEKYFRLANLETKTPEEFAAILAEQQRLLAEQHSNGDMSCLEVRRYPRAQRHIMYVSQGLRSNSPDTPEGFMIPVHFFEFQEFRPEAMRLKDDDYFEYLPAGAELKAALKGFRAEAKFRYRHYLSYDALLVCLELNDLVDENVRRRIDAHYTFLGRYVHPTHNAARDLHLRSNLYTGKPTIGMDSPYTPASRLLLTSYITYLLAGVVDEVAGLVERAPVEYFADTGTGQLRSVISAVPETVPYFWFLFNDAPAYDKFNWAVHHATDEQLRECGGYRRLDSNLIPFNQHILSNFEQGLVGWNNQRVGVYQSPLD